ncbi:caspase domain-containing protein [Desarmillaria tabescens]|uniref:Caspase domain-containing protein n=1 Tax=Armillaria tabescens TaxID=1929756 RepID=A0AA39JHT4_ARMTA|nr:caspase domain-containing protein [Desarmillaria tabescens]KAK0442694.1 caspase domain-containing protein [Desarmillaria tabescens]
MHASALFHQQLSVVMENLNNIKLRNSSNAQDGQAKPERSCEDTKPPLDIFALIIGINSYKCVPKLGGAVPDADKFETFLRTQLGIPPDGIKNLRDEQATRSAVIRELMALKDNTRIVKNKTAIIIYYAGHGARAERPAHPDWTDWRTADGNIELLCPVDTEMTLPTEAGSAKVEAIPDRTISCLLRNLSSTKGNNITLILDCCHSAGLNRDPNGRTRGLDKLLTVSAKCDSDIVSLESQRSMRDTFSDVSSEAHEGFCTSWDSHVLLAACSRSQSAMEKNNEGIFTSALLKAMKKVPVVGLTYKSLMDHLDIPADYEQTPHLDGKHINRRLFSLSGEATSCSMTRCDSLKHVDGQYSLSLRAGFIQGVTCGSIYDIYDTDLPKSAPLATAVVSVGQRASSSCLLLSPKERSFFRNSGAGLWYARLSVTSGYELFAYCNNPILHQTFSQDPDGGTNLRYPFHLTDLRDNADICLEVDGTNLVSFGRGETNSFFKREKVGSYFGPVKQNHIFKKFPNFPSLFSYKPLASDVDEIRNFLDAYAHFTYHITMQSSKDIQDLVSIEMHRLKREMNNGLRIVGDPGDLLSVLATDGFVTITVATESLDYARNSNDAPRYGFTIRNRSDRKLYPHILFFDASTLEIDVMYTNMTSNREKMWQPSRTEKFDVDTCLEANSEVTFGLANGMVRPLLFSIPPGQEVDISFIKIFVTTEPVDLRSILQPSIEEGIQRGAMLRYVCDYIEEWASMTIPLVLVKQKPSLSDDGRSDGSASDS